MPELPEVEIVKQSLDKKIKFKKIKRVIVRNRNLRSKIPKNFEVFLKDKSIEKVKSAVLFVTTSGVLYTVIPTDRAYSISILSKPTA